MDHYIPNDATQKFGPKLRENLAATFRTSPKPVREFLAYVTGLQKAADGNVAGAMKRARGRTSALSSAANEAQPAAVEARKLLTGLHKRLESEHDLGAWSGDVAVFFPEGITGLGYSATAVLAGVKQARGALADDATVPDARKFAKRLGDAQTRLEALVAKSGGALRDAQQGLSEQSAEKQDWLAVYRGIGLIAHGLLVLEKRRTKLAAVVPHLPKGKRRGAKKAGGGGAGGGGAGA